MSKQSKEGTATEKFVAKTFKKFGYWAHILAKAADGSQPCDIFAAKNDSGSCKVWLVDAKHVEEGKVSFAFDRVEANQVSSMSYATGFAKLSNVGFAIYFDRTKQLYWLPYFKYMQLINFGEKSINLNELEKFEEVLENANNY